MCVNQVRGFQIFKIFWNNFSSKHSFKVRILIILFQHQERSEQIIYSMIKRTEITHSQKVTLYLLTTMATQYWKRLQHHCYYCRNELLLPYFEVQCLPEGGAYYRVALILTWIWKDLNLIGGQCLFQAQRLLLLLLLSSSSSSLLTLYTTKLNFGFYISHKLLDYSQHGLLCRPCLYHLKR